MGLVNPQTSFVVPSSLGLTCWLLKPFTLIEEIDKIESHHVVEEPSGISFQNTYILWKAMIRASPAVLNMWSSTVKLDEEKLTNAGLVQENA
jgi:hypothetical protein